MSDDMARLAELAKAQMMAEIDVMNAEANLKECKQRLAVIAENEIPELMGKHGLRRFDTDDLIIVVKASVHASISKERMPEAVVWLREHGYGKILKHRFEIVPEDDDVAHEVEEMLIRAGVEATSSPSVHPMTLKKFVGELLEDGREIDMDLFGVHRRTVSTIKPKE